MHNEELHNCTAYPILHELSSRGDEWGGHVAFVRGRETRTEFW
jgi:hypothetical protein